MLAKTILHDYENFSNSTLIFEKVIKIFILSSKIRSLYFSMFMKVVFKEIK